MGLQVHVKPLIRTWSRKIFDGYVLRKQSWGSAFGATVYVDVYEPWKLESAKLRISVRYDRGNLLNIRVGCDVNDNKVWEELLYVEWRDGYEYPSAGVEKEVSGILKHGSNSFKIWVRGSYGGWAVTVWDVWLDLVYREEPEKPPEEHPPEKPPTWGEQIAEVLKWVTIAGLAIGGVYVLGQVVRRA